MLHGQLDLAGWLVQLYGLWMLCYFTTGLFIISRRCVYVATLVAVTVTYPGLLLWVTFGDLPWVNLLNSGSLQYALFFGDYMLFPGDIEHRINLTTWGVTVSLLTLLFAVLLTVLVRNRRAFAIASSTSESSNQ